MSFSISNINDNKVVHQNAKTSLAIVLSVVYFILEPMFSHVYCLYSIGIVNKPYVVLKIVLPIIVIVYYVCHVIKKINNTNYGVLWPMVIVFLGYLIGCIAGKSEIKVWVETVVPIFALCIFIMPICHKKEYVNLFVTAVADLYLILAFINLVFKLKPELFFFVGTWQEESFIAGNENMSSFPLLMGAFFAILDSFLNGKKLKAASYLVVFFASTYIMWTAAAVICAAILALWLLPSVRALANRVKLSCWVLICFALFAILMWCWKLVVNWEPIRFIMEDVLKKDVTLTGRLDIWSGVLQMFYKKPVFGHGLLDNAQNVYFDTGYNNFMVHAHSAFLQTLYEGGALTLLAVLGMLLFTSAKINKSNNCELNGIFSFFVFLFLINLEVDQFMMYPWRSGCWCMICFLCNFAVMVSKDEY